MEFEFTIVGLFFLGFGACLFIVLGILLAFAIKRDLREKKKNEGQPIKA